MHRTPEDNTFLDEPRCDRINRSAVCNQRSPFYLTALWRLTRAPSPLPVKPAELFVIHRPVRIEPRLDLGIRRTIDRHARNAGQQREAP